MQPLLDVLTNPQWQWTALAIFGTAILQVAAAVWVAGSGRHWFVRALVLWGAVALLVPIRAYEPALLFAISSPLTVAIVLAWRAASRRWFSRLDSVSQEGNASGPSIPPFRFRVVDLLLLMVIVGLAVAALIYIRGNLGPIDWVGLLYTATGLVGFGVAAHAIVFGTHYRKSAIAASVVLMGLAAYLLWIADDWLQIGYLFDKTAYLFANLLGFATAEAQLDRALAVAVLSCFVMLVALWRVALAGWWRPLRILATVCLSVSAAVVLPLWVVLYWRMLWPIPIPRAIADQPNHYERILAIAKEFDASKQDEESIADVRAADPQSPVPARLESLYEEVLPLLESPNSVIVPPPVRMSFDGANQQLIRVLARSFLAESRQAVKAGDLERAVRFAVANIRLGSMSARGGVALDLHVGTSVQGVAASHLASIRRDLPVHLEREVLDCLANSLSAIEPPEDIQRRSAAYYDRWDGWKGRLQLEIDKLRGEEFEEGVPIVHSRRLAILRLLQADLALRAYRREHNRWPESLVHLMVESPHFKAVRPSIPNHHTLHFRPAEDDFLLFAINQLAHDYHKVHQTDYGDGHPHEFILFLDDIALKFE